MDTRSLPGLPRSMVAAVTLCALALLALVALAPGAAAQQQPEPDVGPTNDQFEADPQLPRGDILPRPNTGQAPETAGEPGGWQQYMVFGLIFAGLAVILLFIVRESRQARRQRGPRTPTG